MATATWVVQSNGIKTSQVLPLVEALHSLGEPFRDVGIDTDGIIAGLDVSDKNIIPYGSTHLVKIAEAEGWRHLFFDDNFTVDAWAAHHPRLLNADAVTMTLTEAKRVAPSRPSWFIRPLNDLKAFAGHVITSTELVDWVRRLEVGDCEINGTTLVALSAPKQIQMEWRYLVVGGRIVTGSSYRVNGRAAAHRETDASVLAEAQDLADLWLPHPCCCMDVALCDDRLSVVEFNVINATGFYDHDVKAFASAVSDYARTH